MNEVNYNLGLIKQLLDNEYKYEVTFQSVTYLERERDHFMNKYKQALHAVEQRAGLRVIRLLKFRILS